MKLNIYKPTGTLRPDTSDESFYIKDNPTAISIKKANDGYSLKFHPLHEGSPLIATWFGELSLSSSELEELKIKIEELLAEYPKAEIGVKSTLSPLVESIGQAIGKEMQGKSDIQAILLDILKDMALKIDSLEKRIKWLKGDSAFPVE